MIRNLTVFLLFAALSACASSPMGKPMAAGSEMAVADMVEASATDRQMITRAGIEIEVEDSDASAASVRKLVKSTGGYVEGLNSYREGRLDIDARIPEGKLDPFMDAVAAEGEVLSRRITSTDVTEKMIDIQARLKNLIELRDRIRALLDRTGDLGDLLKVEKELARVQSEIDAITARQKKLRNQVAYSAVNVELKEAVQYGPLGYVGKGVLWAFRSLFVIER